MRLDRHVTLDRCHVRPSTMTSAWANPCSMLPLLYSTVGIRRWLRPGEPGDSAVVNRACVGLEISLGVGMRIVHVVHDANQIHRPLRRILIVGSYGGDGVADIAGATVHEKPIASGRERSLALSRRDTRERRET